MSEDKKPANPVGRPTLYNQEIQDRADKYINDWELYKEIKEKANPEKVMMIVNAIPSIAGLALELGVHRSTIYKWVEAKHSKFIDTLEIIQQKQEVFLIHHGLTKGYDAGFAKFLAINVTSFKDKVEHDVGEDAKEVLLGYQLKPKVENEKQ